MWGLKVVSWADVPTNTFCYLKHLQDRSSQKSSHSERTAQPQSQQEALGYIPIYLVKAKGALAHRLKQTLKKEMYAM